MHVLGTEGSYQPPIDNSLLSLAPPMVNEPPPVTGDSPTRSDKVSDEYSCVLCSPARPFRSMEAYYQHVRSKHGASLSSQVPNSRRTDAVATRDMAQTDCVHTSLENAENGMLTMSGVGGDSELTDQASDAHRATAEVPLPIAEDIKKEHSVPDGDYSMERDLRVECPACGALVLSVEDHIESFQPPEHPDMVCEGCERIFHSKRSLEQHSNFCDSRLKQDAILASANYPESEAV